MGSPRLAQNAVKRKKDVAGKERKEVLSMPFLVLGKSSSGPNFLEPLPKVLAWKEATFIAAEMMSACPRELNHAKPDSQHLQGSARLPMCWNEHCACTSAGHPAPRLQLCCLCDKPAASGQSLADWGKGLLDSTSCLLRVVCCCFEHARSCAFELCANVPLRCSAEPCQSQPACQQSP